VAGEEQTGRAAATHAAIRVVLAAATLALTGCGSQAPAATQASPPPHPLLERDTLVELPAQTVVIGSPDAEPGRDPDEGPAQSIVLRRFWVDRAPVTVGAFEARLSAVLAAVGEGHVVRDADTPAAWVGRCNLGSERRDHPVTCVSPQAARAFCRLRDMDLPTEAEREAFARGGARSAYAWGETFDPTRVISSVECGARGCAGGTTSVVTEGPRCNALGVCDASGHVWEWTVSAYGPALGAQAGVVPESLPDELVIRGGSWLDHEPRLFRSAMRGLPYAEHGLTHVGFRCVRRDAP